VKGSGRLIGVREQSERKVGGKGGDAYPTKKFRCENRVGQRDTGTKTWGQEPVCQNTRDAWRHAEIALHGGLGEEERQSKGGGKGSVSIDSKRRTRGFGW